MPTLPTQQLKNRLTGYLMLLLAVTCWALIGPLARFGLAQGLKPMEIAFWRALLGGIFFICQALFSGQWHLAPRRRIIFILFGIPGVVGLFYSYQLGVQQAGAAMTSVLQYTAPIWVAIWARLFFAERITRIKAFSISLAVSGAAFVSLSGGGLSTGATVTGVIAALAAGFFFSLHFWFGKKYLQNVSPVTLYMHILPAGALFMLPFIDFEIQTKSMWNVWLPILALGFLTGWAGYWAYGEGLKRLAVTRVAVLTTLEPLIASFFAFIWWGELFPPLGWIGVALVISAVLLSIPGK